MSDALHNRYKTLWIEFVQEICIEFPGLWNSRVSFEFEDKFESNLYRLSKLKIKNN